MKIIFSRKGFDSSSGGKPSIVFDKTIVSFPIPQAHSGVFYEDIHTDLGCSYDKLFRDLEITQYSEAHVDPDLYENIYGVPRSKEWRGIFGQDDSAQTHLFNEGVEAGDVFLFFGWYQLADKIRNKYKYKKHDIFKDGFHMLYGFLEIGEIYKVGSNKIPKWAKYHTHVANKGLQSKDNNFIYLAAEQSIHGLHKTFGVFKNFNNINELMLSDKKQKKKSIWEFNENLIGCKISHHGKNVSISNPFETVGRGQEFVVDANDAAQKWVVDFINDHIE